jgi:hypothetical protein
MILVFLAVFCGSSYWHRHSRRSTARKIAAEMIRVEVHQVKALSFYQTLPDSSYLIGKYEVTQQQYRIVMGANPSAHAIAGTFPWRWSPGWMPLSFATNSA